MEKWLDGFIENMHNNNPMQLMIEIFSLFFDAIHTARKPPAVKEP